MTEKTLIRVSVIVNGNSNGKHKIQSYLVKSIEYIHSTAMLNGQ